MCVCVCVFGVDIYSYSHIWPAYFCSVLHFKCCYFVTILKQRKTLANSPT